MKKKSKKIKRKIVKRIRVPKFQIHNPEDSEEERDSVDAFFGELRLSKRIEQEGKYQNQSVIDICNSLLKNLNDDMYHENIVDYMQDINRLLRNLNKKLGI